VSADNLNKFFKAYDPRFLFNLAKGFEAETFGPIKNCGNAQSLPKGTLPKIELPSTCNAARWAAGDGCQVGLKRTTGDMRVVLRMEKCESRDLPFFELSCVGADCDTLAAPCTQDSDCAAGTDMSCMELISTADECGVETCQSRRANTDPNEFSGFFGGLSRQVRPTQAGDCKANAFNPVVTGTSCQLGNAKYGVGFSYLVDKMDLQRTKVPTSPAEIGKCVLMTCASNGSWVESTNGVQAYECVQALTERAEASGNQCPGSGPIVASTRWPFSQDNTCNFHDLKEQALFGLKESAPFSVGSQRVVSNTNEMLGAVMGYDDVDFLANPYGCLASSDMILNLAQLARNIVQRNSGKSNLDLKKTGQLGICLPGQGYSLKPRGSGSSGWTSYEPVIANIDSAEQVIKDHFGVTCSLTCVGGNGNGNNDNNNAAVPIKSRYFDTEQSCADGFFDVSCSAPFTSCVTASGNDLSAMCKCYDSHIACMTKGSFGLCKELYSSLGSLLDSRDQTCEFASRGSGNSGNSSPWGSGNCTATCGKETFAYAAPKYSSAQKFDGANMRKVASVSAITTNAKVLAHVNCIGQAKVLPNHKFLGMELSATGFLEMAAGFRKKHKEAYNCRAQTHGGSSLSNDQYDVRSFTLSNIFYFMTAPVSTQLTDLGAPFRDLRTRLFDSTAGRLEMPSTCTFDFWVKNGQCRLQFSGFSDAAVFGADTSINMLVSVCPGSFLPELYAECVGTGCAFFDGPQTCASENDCALPGFVCHELDKLTSSGGSGRSEKQSGTTVSTQRADESTTEFDVDVIAEATIPMVAAFKFGSPFDLARAELSVTVGLPGGVTQSKKVLLFEGPYTGKFDSVKVSARSRDGSPSCPEQSHQHDILYESSGIYVRSTCSCLLDVDRRRKIAGPQSMQITNLFKRQSSSSESSLTSSALIAGAGAVTGWKNTQQCSERGLTYLVPKLMSLVSGNQFVPAKQGVCFVDFNAVDARGKSLLENWANDQIQIDGSVIKLKNLKAWSDGKNLQPIDDGVTIRDTFGKDTPWLEMQGKFCFDCAEGVNTDVGDTKQENGVVALAVSMLAIALSAIVLVL
jgi:hypothetical protein